MHSALTVLRVVDVRCHVFRHSFVYCFCVLCFAVVLFAVFCCRWSTGASPVFFRGWFFVYWCFRRCVLCFALFLCFGVCCSVLWTTVCACEQKHAVTAVHGLNIANVVTPSLLATREPFHHFLACVLRRREAPPSEPRDACQATSSVAKRPQRRDIAFAPVRCSACKLRACVCAVVVHEVFYFVHVFFFSFCFRRSSEKLGVSHFSVFDLPI